MHSRRRLLFALLILFSSSSLFAQTQPYTHNPIPGTLQAEHYDLGGDEVAYSDLSDGNAFQAFRNEEDVDVGAIPSGAGGGYHIGAVQDDEWAKYTVIVAETGIYDVTLRWASDYSAPTTFRLSVDGMPPFVTQEVSATGGWQSYQTKHFNMHLTAGTHVLRVDFVQGAWNFDSLEFRRQRPYNEPHIPIPGTLQAEHYDHGGNEVAYRDFSAGNAFGAFRVEEDMDVGAIPGGNDYHIGFLADGEWAEYTVNIAEARTYNVTLRRASAYAGPNSFRLLLDDLQGVQRLLATVTVTPTSGWQSYDTIQFPVTFDRTGLHILRIEFTQGAWNFDSLVFPATVCTQPPSIIMSDLDVIVKEPGDSYTFAPQVSDADSYQWLRNGNVIATSTTSAALALSDLEQEKDGGTYQLLATNNCGTTPSPVKTLRVKCPRPSDNTYNIYRVLNGQQIYCDFLEDMANDFPKKGTSTGGSFNKPPISAAVALIDEPIRNDPTGKSWNAYEWWKLYLQGELGRPRNCTRCQDCNNCAGCCKDWHYGGQEFGSNTYQHFNIVSVMAVYYWAKWSSQPVAHQADMATIADLAQEWLRATFTMHALAAAKSFPATKNTDVEPGTGVTVDFRDFCHNAPDNCVAYNGPYIAMAGERTLEEHWNSTYRSIFFNRAVDLIPGARMEGPEDYIRKTREQLESFWQLRSGDARNAYGLTLANRTTLKSIVETCDRPNDLVGYYLSDKIRTKDPYYFLNWHNPIVRATLMGSASHNGTTVPTMGTAYFHNDHPVRPRQAHFLFPWLGAFSGNTPNGTGGAVATGSLDDLASGVITSTNNASAGSLHGPWHVKIENLPTTRPCYRLTLSPTAPPFEVKSGAPSTPANLAFGKFTTQSSTYSGSPLTNGPQLAVDGNTDGNYFNGSVTHTGLDAGAWWQVDLGSISSIDQIQVWNRTDCCPDRLSSFYVFVSDVPFSSTDLSATINQPGVWYFSIAGPAGTPSSITVGRSGRFVRVQLSTTNYLSLAEVQVLGQAGTPPPDTGWVDDSLPGGAIPGANGGDNWTWISSSPGPYSGSLAHQSNIYGGMHQHYFTGATQTLTVQTGDVLFAYVYLDPSNPPSEVMLQWNDGSMWEHRAYWGANQMAYGTDGTMSRRYMGPLPATGQWVRLEVPASLVGLEGQTLNGMAFTLFGGRATWDRAGKNN